MKIVICDDEKNFLDKLATKIYELVSELEINVMVLKYQSGGRLLESYKAGVNIDIDIIFMDILMGSENGYQIAAQIRQIDTKVRIIFITSVMKYALKGYEIGATRYLVKPINDNKIRSVLISTINEVIDSSEQYIIEKNDEGIFKLFFDDIIYIETSGRNTIIHSKDKNIISYKTMKSHLNNLNSHFIRCHAAYIVNLAYIVELTKSEIILKNNIIIPLSKNRRKELKESLMNFYTSYLDD